MGNFTSSSSDLHGAYTKYQRPRANEHARSRSGGQSLSPEDLEWLNLHPLKLLDDVFVEEKVHNLPPVDWAGSILADSPGASSSSPHTEGSPDERTTDRDRGQNALFSILDAVYTTSASNAASLSGISEEEGLRRRKQHVMDTLLRGQWCRQSTLSETGHHQLPGGASTVPSSADNLEGELLQKDFLETAFATRLKQVAPLYLRMYQGMVKLHRSLLFQQQDETKGRNKHSESQSIQGTKKLTANITDGDQDKKTPDLAVANQGRADTSPSKIASSFLLSTVQLAKTHARENPEALRYITSSLLELFSMYPTSVLFCPASNEEKEAAKLLTELCQLFLDWTLAKSTARDRSSFSSDDVVKAVELCIAVSVLRGSLSLVLKCIHSLLQLLSHSKPGKIPLSKGPNAFSSTVSMPPSLSAATPVSSSIIQSLDSLGNYEANMSLHPLREKDRLQNLAKIRVHLPFSDEISRYSMAVGKVFLYVWFPSGLLKIGSGFHDSVPGKVYAQNTQVRWTNERSSPAKPTMRNRYGSAGGSGSAKTSAQTGTFDPVMACVGDLLYLWERFDKVTVLDGRTLELHETFTASELFTSSVGSQSETVEDAHLSVEIPPPSSITLDNNAGDRALGQDDQTLRAVSPGYIAPDTLPVPMVDHEADRVEEGTAIRDEEEEKKTEGGIGEEMEMELSDSFLEQDRERLADSFIEERPFQVASTPVSTSGLSVRPSVSSSFSLRRTPEPIEPGQRHPMTATASSVSHRERTASLSSDLTNVWMNPYRLSSLVPSSLTDSSRVTHKGERRTRGLKSAFSADTDEGEDQAESETEKSEVQAGYSVPRERRERLDQLVMQMIESSPYRGPHIGMELRSRGTTNMTLSALIEEDGEQDEEDFDFNTHGELVEYRDSAFADAGAAQSVNDTLQNIEVEAQDESLNGMKHRGALESVGDSYHSPELQEDDIGEIFDVTPREPSFDEILDVDGLVLPDGYDDEEEELWHNPFTMQPIDNNFQQQEGDGRGPHSRGRNGSSSSSGTGSENSQTLYDADLPPARVGRARSSSNTEVHGSANLARDDRSRGRDERRKQTERAGDSDYSSASGGECQSQRRNQRSRADDYWFMVELASASANHLPVHNALTSDGKWLYFVQISSSSSNEHSESSPPLFPGLYRHEEGRRALNPDMEMTVTTCDPSDRLRKAVRKTYISIYLTEVLEKAVASNSVHLDSSATAAEAATSFLEALSSKKGQESDRGAEGENEEKLLPFASFYTNGKTFVIILRPPDSTYLSMQSSSTRPLSSNRLPSLWLGFDCVSGVLQKAAFVKRRHIGQSFCFDGHRNIILSLDASLRVVRRWRNTSQAVPLSPPSPLTNFSLHSSRLSFNLSPLLRSTYSAGGSSNHFQPTLSYQFILQVLSQLSIKVGDLPVLLLAHLDRISEPYYSSGSNAGELNTSHSGLSLLYNGYDWNIGMKTKALSITVVELSGVDDRFLSVDDDPDGPVEELKDSSAANKASALLQMFLAQRIRAFKTRVKSPGLQMWLCCPKGQDTTEDFLLEGISVSLSAGASNFSHGLVFVTDSLTQLDNDQISYFMSLSKDEANRHIRKAKKSFKNAGKKGSRLRRDVSVPVLLFSSEDTPTGCSRVNFKKRVYSRSSRATRKKKYDQVIGVFACIVFVGKDPTKDWDLEIQQFSLVGCTMGSKSVSSPSGDKSPPHQIPFAVDVSSEAFGLLSNLLSHYVEELVSLTKNDRKRNGGRLRRGSTSALMSTSVWSRGRTQSTSEAQEMGEPSDHLKGLTSSRPRRRSEPTQPQLLPTIGPELGAFSSLVSGALPTDARNSQGTDMTKEVPWKGMPPQEEEISLTLYSLAAILRLISINISALRSSHKDESNPADSENFESVKRSVDEISKSSLLLVHHILLERLALSHAVRDLCLDVYVELFDMKAVEPGKKLREIEDMAKILLSPPQEASVTKAIDADMHVLHVLLERYRNPEHLYPLLLGASQADSLHFLYTMLDLSTSATKEGIDHSTSIISSAARGSSRATKHYLVPVIYRKILRVLNSMMHWAVFSLISGANNGSSNVISFSAATGVAASLEHTSWDKMASFDVLSQLLKACTSLLAYGKGAMKKRRNTAFAGSDSDLFAVLKRSIVGYLLPSLMEMLSLLHIAAGREKEQELRNSESSFSSENRHTNLLTGLASSRDNFTTMLQVLGGGTLHLSSQDHRFPSRKQIQEIETRHPISVSKTHLTDIRTSPMSPCPTQTEIESDGSSRVVEIPVKLENVSSLKIFFDMRCELPTGHSLAIREESGGFSQENAARTFPVLPFTPNTEGQNAANQFGPFTCNGNSCTILWVKKEGSISSTSDAPKEYWGWRCVVVGVWEEHQIVHNINVGWIYRVEQALALLCATLCMTLPENTEVSNAIALREGSELESEKHDPCASLAEKPDGPATSFTSGLSLTVREHLKSPISMVIDDEDSQEIGAEGSLRQRQDQTAPVEDFMVSISVQRLITNILNPSSSNPSSELDCFKQRLYLLIKQRLEENLGQMLLTALRDCDSATLVLLPSELLEAARFVFAGSLWYAFPCSMIHFHPPLAQIPEELEHFIKFTISACERALKATAINMGHQCILTDFQASFNEEQSALKDISSSRISQYSDAMLHHLLHVEQPSDIPSMFSPSSAISCSRGDEQIGVVAFRVFRTTAHSLLQRAQYLLQLPRKATTRYRNTYSASAFPVYGDCKDLWRWREHCKMAFPITTSAHKASNSHLLQEEITIKGIPLLTSFWFPFQELAEFLLCFRYPELIFKEEMVPSSTPHTSQCSPTESEPKTHGNTICSVHREIEAATKIFVDLLMVHSSLEGTQMLVLCLCDFLQNRLMPAMGSITQRRRKREKEETHGKGYANNDENFKDRKREAGFPLSSSKTLTQESALSTNSQQLFCQHTCLVWLHRQCIMLYRRLTQLLDVAYHVERAAATPTPLLEDISSTSDRVSSYQEESYIKNLRQLRIHILKALNVLSWSAVELEESLIGFPFEEKQANAPLQSSAAGAPSPFKSLSSVSAVSISEVLALLFREIVYSDTGTDPRFYQKRSIIISRALQMSLKEVECTQKNEIASLCFSMLYATLSMKVDDPLLSSAKSKNLSYESRATTAVLVQVLKDFSEISGVSMRQTAFSRMNSSQIVFHLSGDRPTASFSVPCPKILLEPIANTGRVPAADFFGKEQPTETTEATSGGVRLSFWFYRCKGVRSKRGRSDGDIRVGDVVRRGPGWMWADQDGGKGNIGVVESITSWKGIPDQGVTVRWEQNGKCNTYRWGGEGNYDVEILEEVSSRFLFQQVVNSRAVGLGAIVREDGVMTYGLGNMAIFDSLSPLSAPIAHATFGSSRGVESRVCSGQTQWTLLPSDQWVHLSFALERNNKVTLLVNGKFESELQVDSLQLGNSLLESAISAELNSAFYFGSLPSSHCVGHKEKVLPTDGWIADLRVDALGKSTASPHIHPTDRSWSREKAARLSSVALNSLTQKQDEIWHSPPTSHRIPLRIEELQVISGQADLFLTNALPENQNDTTSESEEYLYYVSPRSNFPTISAWRARLTTGRWYFEVEIISAQNITQIGWTCNGFTPNSAKGFGVGDDSKSWSFDGSRMQRWHQQVGVEEEKGEGNEDYRGGSRGRSSISDPSGTVWGKKWKEGDVIGCAIDIEKQEILYSLNGSFESPMGVAFQGFSQSQSSILYRTFSPAVSVQSPAKVRINLGPSTSPGTPSSLLSHSPPEGFLPVQAWIDAKSEENAILYGQWCNEVEIETTGRAPATPLPVSPPRSGPLLHCDLHIVHSLQALMLHCRTCLPVLHALQDVHSLKYLFRMFLTSPFDQIVLTISQLLLEILPEVSELDVIDRSFKLAFPSLSVSLSSTNQGPLHVFTNVLLVLIGLSRASTLSLKQRSTFSKPFRESGIIWVFGVEGEGHKLKSPNSTRVALVGASRAVRLAALSSFLHRLASIQSPVSQQLRRRLSESVSTASSIQGTQEDSAQQIAQFLSGIGAFSVISGFQGFLPGCRVGFRLTGNKLVSLKRSSTAAKNSSSSARLPPFQASLPKWKEGKRKGKERGTSFESSCIFGRGIIAQIDEDKECVSLIPDANPSHRITVSLNDISLLNYEADTLEEESPTHHQLFQSPWRPSWCLFDTDLSTTMFQALKALFPLCMKPHLEAKHSIEGKSKDGNAGRGMALQPDSQLRVSVSSLASFTSATNAPSRWEIAVQDASAVILSIQISATTIPPAAALLIYSYASAEPRHQQEPSEGSSADPPQVYLSSVLTSESLKSQEAFLHLVIPGNKVRVELAGLTTPSLEDEDWSIAIDVHRGTRGELINGGMPSPQIEIRALYMTALTSLLQSHAKRRALKSWHFSCHFLPYLYALSILSPEDKTLASASLPSSGKPSLLKVNNETQKRDDGGFSNRFAILGQQLLQLENYLIETHHEDNVATTKAECRVDDQVQASAWNEKHTEFSRAPSHQAPSSPQNAENEIDDSVLTFTERSRQRMLQRMGEKGPNPATQVALGSSTKYPVREPSPTPTSTASKSPNKKTYLSSRQPVIDRPLPYLRSFPEWQSLLHFPVSTLYGGDGQPEAHSHRDLLKDTATAYIFEGLSQNIELITQGIFDRYGEECVGGESMEVPQLVLQNLFLWRNIVTATVDTESARVSSTAEESVGEQSAHLAAQTSSLSLWLLTRLHSALDDLSFNRAAVLQALCNEASSQKWDSTDIRTPARERIVQKGEVWEIFVGMSILDYCLHLGGQSIVPREYQSEAIKDDQKLMLSLLENLLHSHVIERALLCPLRSSGLDLFSPALLRVIDKLEKIHEGSVYVEACDTHLMEGDKTKEILLIRVISQIYHASVALRAHIKRCEATDEELSPSEHSLYSSRALFAKEVFVRMKDLKARIKANHVSVGRQTGNAGVGDLPGGCLEAKGQDCQQTIHDEVELESSLGKAEEPDVQDLMEVWSLLRQTSSGEGATHEESAKDEMCTRKKSEDEKQRLNSLLLRLCQRSGPSFLIGNGINKTVVSLLTSDQCWKNVRITTRREIWRQLLHQDTKVPEFAIALKARPRTRQGKFSSTFIAQAFRQLYFCDVRLLRSNRKTLCILLGESDDILSKKKREFRKRTAKDGEYKEVEHAVGEESGVNGVDHAEDGWKRHHLSSTSPSPFAASPSVLLSPPRMKSSMSIGSNTSTVLSSPSRNFHAQENEERGESDLPLPVFFRIVAMELCSNISHLFHPTPNKLMGFAIRAGVSFDLRLASFVWKALLGRGQYSSSQRSLARDLFLYDAIAFDALQYFDISPETRADVTNIVGETGVGETFCSGRRSSKASVVDLPEVDRRRAQHMRKVASLCQSQVTAMREGLLSVIPLEFLAFCSADDHELLVTNGGRQRLLFSPTVPVSPFQEVAVITGGLTEDSPEVVCLWQAEKALAPSDERRWLRGVTRCRYGTAIKSKIARLSLTILPCPSRSALHLAQRDGGMIIHLPPISDVDTMKCLMILEVERVESESNYSINDDVFQ